MVYECAFRITGQEGESFQKKWEMDAVRVGAYQPTFKLVARARARARATARARQG